VPLEKSVVSPILIGRTDQLSSLGRLIAKVRGGHQAIALIGGEAGIGKSRLVAEARNRAAALDWLILQGNCFENDTALPFAPWLDMLRTFCAEHSSDELLRYLGASASDLVKLLPELVTRLPELVPAPTLEPQQEKHRLFESLGQFFSGLAVQHPVLVVVEDLHWSDETSLECLLRLAHRVASQPIFFLGTYRADEVSAALTHFLVELDRGRLATELVLSRLSLDEVDAMLRAIFEVNRAIRMEFLKTIYAQTEGNPFFIEEILKSLIMAGVIFFAGGTWDRKPMAEIDIPRSVQEAVRRRVERVSRPARQTLTLAAVAGKVVSFSLLEELSGMSESELTEQIKELVAAQLLVEESADRFSFRHALTREAVYGTLLKRERQRFHRAIAEMLERTEGSSSGGQLASLSYHFFEGALWTKALEYAQRAGEQAQSLYAPREAIEHLTRAFAAAGQRSMPVSPALYRSRGRAYETLGDFEAARGDYEQALNAARTARDGEAEWHILIELGSLWAGRDYLKTGEYFQRATDLALGLSDPKFHAHSLNRLANWYVNVGRNLEGLQAHRLAFAIFEQEADRQAMADTLDLMGMATLQLGDQVASGQNYQRAIGLFRALSDKRGLASALIGSSHSAYWAETVSVPLRTRDETLRETAEALELTRQIGWAAGQAFSEWSAAVYLANFGDFGQALAHARESLRLATEIEHRQWIIAAHRAFGYIYVVMLLPDLAIQSLEVAMPLARELGSAWWVGNITTELALAYLLQNDAARAAAVLDSTLNAEQPARNMVERRMLWAKGHVMLARGTPEKAAHLADELIESAPGIDKLQYIPHLLKLKGDALLALDRLEEAEQAFRGAEQGARERFEPPLLWQIHRSLGRVFQRLKRVRRAETEFAAAREIIRTLAQTIPDPALCEAYTRTALESLPKEKSASPRRAESGKYGGLTEREREVARLVAQGKTNREIAGILVLSERTVENYVGNTLAKLGFDSRSQIAVWAVEIGLRKS